MTAQQANPSVSLDEAALSDRELEVYAPLAMDILAGRSTLRQIVDTHAHQLSAEVVEHLAGADEFYADGHFRRWCERRPALAEIQLTREQLEDACASMPADAPRSGPASTPGVADPTVAVIVPVVVTLFEPVPAQFGAPNAENMTTLFASVNEIFAGAQWRAGYPGSRSPPRAHSPRPETGIRLELVDMRVVTDASLAVCEHGATGMAESIFMRESKYGLAPTNVINMFVCDMQASAGGFANFFGSVYMNTRMLATPPPPADIIEAAQRSSIPPLVYSHLASMSTAHEFGHALCLHHTFEGGCGIEGDGVDDTPPMQQAPAQPAGGFNTCPEYMYEMTLLYLRMEEQVRANQLQTLMDNGWPREAAEAYVDEHWPSDAEFMQQLQEAGPELLGGEHGEPPVDSCPEQEGVDAVYNVMSYSFCGARFTPGQVERMHASALGTGALGAWQNRRPIWAPSELRRRWWLVGAGHCDRTVVAEEHPVAREDDCLQLGERHGAVVSWTQAGPCRVFSGVDGTECRRAGELAERGGHWLTYARRTQPAAEQAAGWILDAPSTATLELSARALPPGAPLAVRVVQDPFLRAHSNWLALYPAGASAQQPLDGSVVEVGALPLVGADETGRREERELRITTPARTGEFEIRLYCCGGYMPLLGAHAAQRAAVLVSEDAAARDAYVALAAARESATAAGPAKRGSGDDAQSGGGDAEEGDDATATGAAAAALFVLVLVGGAGAYAAHRAGMVPPELLARLPAPPQLPGWARTLASGRGPGAVRGERAGRPPMV